jgi:DNA repair protein RecO (recombination protein O)
MSDIVKTEAIVLTKLDYGDTSTIVTLYTKEFGKLSAIIKGGRSPKSRIGLIVDPVNYIQVVLYKKDSRDLQLISSADLISYYKEIKENYEKLKYSTAIIELLKKLTVEHEVNDKLFRGVIKILTKIDSNVDDPINLFARFFIFFLSELGYAIQLDKCVLCGRTNLEASELSYNFEFGILCNECRKIQASAYNIEPELFNYLFRLKNNKKIELLNPAVAEKAIVFLERYLKFHISDFKGIQSFQVFK